MSKLDSPISVMVAVYDNEIDAALGTSTLERMEQEGEIELQDAAIAFRAERRGLRANRQV